MPAVRLIVIGAGGFGREVVDLAVACSHEVVGFYDEDRERAGTTVRGMPVVCERDALAYDGFALAVGDTAARARLYVEFAAVSEAPVLVHPSACVSPSASLGAGTLVMQNVVVNADAAVGEACILNVGCCVAHDCRVGAACHLAPAVQMAGYSAVGERVFCGTASVILSGIEVGDGAVCGAGAVVTKPVAEGWVVVGVPARPMRRAGA